MIHDPLNHKERIVEAVLAKTNRWVSKDTAVAIAEEVLPYLTTYNHNSKVQDILGLIQAADRSDNPSAKATALAAKDALSLYSAAQADRAAMAAALRYFDIPFDGYIKTISEDVGRQRREEIELIERTIKESKTKIQILETTLSRYNYELRKSFIENGLIGMILAPIFGKLYGTKAVTNILFFVLVMCAIGMVSMASAIA